MSGKFEQEANGLERYFSEFIQRLAGDQGSPELFAAVSGLARARGEGHICINLSSVADGKSAEALGDLLLATSVVGLPGETVPLIIDGSSLYLHRYHQAETLVADFIKKRQKGELHDLPLSAFTAALQKFFPGADRQRPDWQQVAAMAAISRKFTVISGGPGTGKTTTVAKILAIYQELYQGQGRVIRLAAPTGKAAARLQESIQEAKVRLPVSEERRDELPHETVTIHRLLGLFGGRPRYSRQQPLNADLVVIDEASMVDLPLMAQLMDALPEECSLVLLGDHYQLSSVQPGAVLGDICSRGEGFTDQFQQLANDMGVQLGSLASRENSLADSIITLRDSYRFDENSGIRRLSEAVNGGQGEEALAILADESCPDVKIDDYGASCENLVETALYPIFASFTNARRQGEHFDSLGKLGVLCAHRQGSSGMERINELLVKLGARAGGAAKPLYPGLPIMIASNNYELELYNGDTGVISQENGRFYACFPAYQGVHRVLARRLPPYNPAYAMTVHKSQGSEFERVVVVLPAQPSRVLGRELLYTALTRARQSVEIWGKREIFLQAVATPVQRVSGLSRRLWGHADVHQS